MKIILTNEMSRKYLFPKQIPRLMYLSGDAEYCVIHKLLNMTVIHLTYENLISEYECNIENDIIKFERILFITQ